MEKVNDTTYAKVISDDLKDKIIVEVGDRKQEDFKPQFKIMRWDNEVNFSMRAEEKAGAELVAEEDGTIKYVTPEYEVHQYDKPDASEEGGFEFEWILNQKPVSNVLSATIQTKGLDFFYQAPLTQELIDQGFSMPENVEGSYAVYHQSKGVVNDSGGHNYRSGKAFHIFRPKAIDAKKEEVWCDLNIDVDAGILTVTVPEKFLENASYPVVVDPTFGWTGIGQSNSTYAQLSDDSSRRRGVSIKVTMDGLITGYNAVLNSTGANENCDTYVFLMNEDTVGDAPTLHASSEILDLPTTTTAKWFFFPSGLEAVTANTFYILGIVGNGEDLVTGSGCSIRGDFRDANRQYFEAFIGAGGYAASKEDPWTVSDGANSFFYSQYITVTTGGPAFVQNKLRPAIFTPGIAR